MCASRQTDLQNAPRGETLHRRAPAPAAVDTDTLMSSLAHLGLPDRPPAAAAAPPAAAPAAAAGAKVDEHGDCGGLVAGRQENG